MHLCGLLAAILAGRYTLSDLAYAIIKQRPIDETGPDVQDIDQLVFQVFETPGLIGMGDPVAVVCAQALVKINDALHKGWRKNPDAAVIQQIYAGSR